MAPSSGRFDHGILTSFTALLLLMQFDRGGGFSMLSRDQLYVMNAGETIQLDCEFYTTYFNLFDNPVLWIKSQYHEQTRINIMGNINHPFVDTKRFKVTFLPAPPRYRLVLGIERLSLEDSGNYSCEVRGLDTTVLGYTTHKLFIRAPVQDLTINQDNCSGSGSCDLSTPTSLSFMENYPSLLQCVATGGNPPPELQVFLDDFDITYRFETEIYTNLLGELGLRIMHSSVHTRTNYLVLESNDDGKVLTCRATIAGLPNNVTSTKISVKYAPVISCRTFTAYVHQRNANITCIVKARPRANSIMWFIDNNGTIVTEGVIENEYWTHSSDLSDGSIVTQLFMRQAKPEAFRKYKVVAENIVGKTSENIELLKVYGTKESNEEDAYYDNYGGERPQGHVDYIFISPDGAQPLFVHVHTLTIIAFHLAICFIFVHS